MAQGPPSSESGRLVFKAPARVLLDLLVRRGFVPPEETAPLLEASRVTRRAVCLLLLDLGLLQETALAEALVNAWNVPYVNLDCHTVDPAVLKLVGPALAWERRVLPLDRSGRTMTLAMVDPLDDMAASRVTANNRCSICRAVCLASEFQRAFDRHFPEFKKPEKSFGPADAAKAVKAARISIAESPMRQAAARAGESLPGWLSEKSEPGALAGAAAGAKAGAPAGEISMPDWLDEEPERPARPAQQAPAAQAKAPPRAGIAPRPPLGKTLPPGGAKGGRKP